MRYWILIAVAALVLLAGSSSQVSPQSAHAADPKIVYHVPVVINIYPNSGTTPDQAKDAIEKANEILKEAGIILRPLLPIHTGVTGGDDGEDGIFGSAGERDDVRKYGTDELKKLSNEKGLKISFGKRIDFEKEDDAVGVAVDENPTIIIKGGRGDVTTGQDIAHEFGHVLGLSDQYTDPSNFMYGNSGGTPTGMTPAQIETMTGTGWTGLGGRNISDFSKCAKQFSRLYPAEKCAIQFGVASDALGDQSGSAPPAFYDLDQVFLNSLHATDQVGGDVDNVYAQITVSGLLPTAEEIDATYALGFDIDANSGTGVTYAGYDGIDRIVYVNATGNIGLGTFSLSGTVLDPTAAVLSSFETPLAKEDDLFVDFADELEPAVSTPVATSFLARIPKSLLNLSDGELPAVAAAGLAGSLTDFSDDVLYDVTDDLTFDTLRFLSDPTLETFGNGVPTPGQPYPFSVSGLQPNDSFDLYLDDQIVSSGLLDISGSFSGSFVFPLAVPTDELHFLAAQDSTGEFAYSMTCPERSGGGIAEPLAGGSDAPAIASDGSGGSFPYAAVVAAGALAVLAAGGWYTRRRFLR